MAPDKIYMPNELLSEEWCRHIEGQDTEYIRKDALLERLEHFLKCIEDECDKYDKASYRKAYLMGEIDAYKLTKAILEKM